MGELCLASCEIEIEILLHRTLQLCLQSLILTGVLESALAFVDEVTLVPIRPTGGQNRNQKRRAESE